MNFSSKLLSFSLIGLLPLFPLLFLSGQEIRDFISASFIYNLYILISSVGVMAFNVTFTLSVMSYLHEKRMESSIAGTQ